MLVISRNVDKEVILEGDGMPTVVVKVLGVERNRVKLGFTAPESVSIWRREVKERRESEGEE